MSKSVAIVSGASQGIGRATAIRLARDFSGLVLVARNRAHLDETAEAVKAGGADALVIDVDLGLRTAARTVVEQAVGAFGRIDALLNIAGAVPQIDLFEMTDEQWEAGLALKLHGARRLTVAAWPALKAGRRSEVDLTSRQQQTCYSCHGAQHVLYLPIYRYRTQQQRLSRSTLSWSGSSGAPIASMRTFSREFVAAGFVGRSRPQGIAGLPLPRSQIDFTSPPSIRSVEPVIHRALVETRKAIKSAISSGSP